MQSTKHELWIVVEQRDATGRLLSLGTQSIWTPLVSVVKEPTTWRILSVHDTWHEAEDAFFSRQEKRKG